TVQPRVRRPFLGSPFSISTVSATTIQSEDFDLGGGGLAYHDTTACLQIGRFSRGCDARSSVPRSPFRPCPRRRSSRKTSTSAAKAWPTTTPRPASRSEGSAAGATPVPRFPVLHFDRVRDDDPVGRLRPRRRRPGLPRHHARP